MRTVGIITFYKSENIGAVLQAFALQYSLAKLGYHAEIIQYTDAQKKTAHIPRGKLFLHNLWYHTIKRSMLQDKKWRRICAFIEEYDTLSPEAFHSAALLHQVPPIYDIYITGSDQVWNPSITGNDEAYFLTFAPVTAVRFSYGASLGNISILKKQTEKMKYLIGQLDAVSVREKDAAEAICELIGAPVTQVLDPTLLLNSSEWASLTEKTPSVVEYPYILCYYMPGDKAIEAGIRKASEYIKKITGLRIVNIGKKDWARLGFHREDIFDNGPLEFLWLIQHASYVVTNSFHGTAFSANLKRSFFVPIKTTENKQATRSSRIVSFLDMLGLNDRMFEVDDNGRALSDIYPALEMDYRDAYSRLKTARADSVLFLKNNCNRNGAETQP